MFPHPIGELPRIAVVETDHAGRVILPQQALSHLRTALRIANAAVVADIETNCPALRSPCGRITWYDVRPMLDEREHAPTVVDMAREAMAYGIEAGLLVRHDEHPHWVRVAQPGR